MAIVNVQKKTMQPLASSMVEQAVSTVSSAVDVSSLHGRERGEALKQMQGRMREQMAETAGERYQQRMEAQREKNAQGDLLRHKQIGVDSRIPPHRKPPVNIPTAMDEVPAKPDVLEERPSLQVEDLQAMQQEAIPNTPAPDLDIILDGHGKIGPEMPTVEFGKPRPPVDIPTAMDQMPDNPHESHVLENIGLPEGAAISPRPSITYEPPVGGDAVPNTPAPQYVLGGEARYSPEFETPEGPSTAAPFDYSQFDVPYLDGRKPTIDLEQAPIPRPPVSQDQYRHEPDKVKIEEIQGTGPDGGEVVTGIVSMQPGDISEHHGYDQDGHEVVSNIQADKPGIRKPKQLGVDSRTGKSMRQDEQQAQSPAQNQSQPESAAFNSINEQSQPVDTASNLINEQSQPEGATVEENKHDRIMNHVGRALGSVADGVGAEAQVQVGE